ncbi:MAG: hypothetical protein AAB465_01620 [Patescibacteria group bacterium]
MSINLLINDNQPEEEKKSKPVDNKSASRLIDFVLPKKDNSTPAYQPEKIEEAVPAEQEKEAIKELLPLLELSNNKNTPQKNKSFWQKLFSKNKKNQEKSLTENNQPTLSFRPLAEQEADKKILVSEEKSFNQTTKSAKDKFFDFFKNTSSEPSKAPQDLSKGEPATDRVLPTESFSSINLGVSLVPEEIPITQRMIIEGALKLIAFVLVSILLVFFGRLYAVHQYEVAKENIVRIQNDISTYDAQINALLPIRNQINTLGSKAQRVESLLKNHIYWTSFFAKLEEYTMPDIYWGDFGADTSGKISLTATGKDLISAARQLVALSNAPDFIKSVSIAGIRGGTLGISFTANLELVPNLFNK